MNTEALRTTGVYILRLDREETQYEHGSAWDDWRLYITFIRGRHDKNKSERKDK